MPYVRYISDLQHYNEVLSKVASVKKSLWIGTADIKDLHVKVGDSSEPFLAILAELLKRGVEIRLNSTGILFSLSVWKGLFALECISR